MENTVQSTAIDFPFRMLHIVDCMAFHRNQCHVQIYIVNKCHNQNTIMFHLFYYKIMSRKNYNTAKRDTKFNTATRILTATLVTFI